MKIYRKTEKDFKDYAAELMENDILAVCDVNTEPFADEILRRLSEYGKKAEKYCFADRHLLPETEKLGGLSAAATEHAYILGIGSGVINDICKYISFKTEKPYGILATAPSMDGYVSGVSALYDKGRKVTWPTTVPREVLVDTNILKNAPLEMIVAGEGDLIGKYTSLLDWKLSHCLNGEKYDPEIAERMREALALSMGSAEKLVCRDETAVGALIDGLVLSGVEMQRAGNSRPASGSEHHISHYLEMQGEKSGKEYAPHGVKVALGCLVSSAMYRYAENFPELADVRGDIRQLPDTDRLKELYKKIGLPVGFNEIGVSKALLEETIKNAWTVRERYTIMTFLKDKGELGKLAPVLADMFA